MDTWFGEDEEDEEVYYYARDAETIEMFHFNDEELVRFRDGFGVAQASRGWLWTHWTM
jgi:hypothetical protein